MREGKPAHRPSQVTMAGWVAVVGSFLVVVSLYDAISQLHSVEVRDSIARFLAEPPADGLGIELSEAVGLLRGLMMFAGAASAAALVLGIFVLRGNNGARIGFTVAAALLVATAPVSGFLSLIVAFAAVLLWTRPARDWFAGRPPAPAAERGTRTRAYLSERDPADDRPADQTGEEPRPTEGFGRPQPPSYPGPGPEGGGGQSAAGSEHGHGAPQAPQEGAGQPPPEQGHEPAYGGQSPYGQASYGQPPTQWPYGQPPGQQPGQQPPYYGQPYYGYPQHGEPYSDRRPTTVTVAAWITWVFTVLTAALFGLVVAVLLVAPRDLYDTLRNEPQLAQAGLTVDDLISVLWVTSAVFLFWCLAAFVLAVLAFRRVNWARITLVVSAGATATFSLLSVVGFPGSIVTLLAAGAVIVLLFTGGANAWFSRTDRPGGGYPPYPPQPQEQRPQPPKNVW